MTDVIMTVRNPLDHRDLLPVVIRPNDTELAHDWVTALRQEIQRKSPLEKNYCWHGWPNTQRNLEYLTLQLEHHAHQLASFNDQGGWVALGLEPYPVRTDYSPTDVIDPVDEGPNHAVMNLVHNYFENLQGTVEDLSPYYRSAPPAVKYSIRQLNLLCHEIESLCLSLRKQKHDPKWVRPSQITTFINPRRHRLTNQHRSGFLTNGYDRRFGHVYMHWTQIGKTLMEVFNDEHAPHLDAATCDAITHLQYYSGEFDVEWGRDILYGHHDWHTQKIDAFNQWLVREGFDPQDPQLSLGYLELGRIDFDRSFGTQDVDRIWQIMGNHLDIYSIAVGDDVAVYDYSWADADHEKRQISQLMPGYLSNF